MSDNKALFIEEAIIGEIKQLLAERVNEIFNGWQMVIPVIEFSHYQSMKTVVPVISLSGCERTEKERIVRLDAYSVKIAIDVPETPDSELFCYGYAAAVGKAVGENLTLGGVADRVVITGKKYVPPKAPNCGDNWEVVINLRVTVEGLNNAG
jgi:hypothetical protein